MTRPSESPQISFRETATPPRFAGLTLPPALRELCPQPENAASNGTPRRAEMSALATRLRKIQLDISPTEKHALPSDNVSPSRLEFDDDDNDGDGIDKENLVQKAGPVGTAIWGLQDKKELQGVKERHHIDALEQPALKMNSQVPGKRSGGKEGQIDECSPDTEQRRDKEELQATPFIPQKPETTLPRATDNEVQPVPQKSETSPQRSDEGQGKDHFKRNLQKILDGKNKWPWLERCRAMSSLTESLSRDPKQEFVEHTKSVLNSLSSKLNDHLDELRPSVITSALGLVNAIISLNMEGGSSFAEEVFPSIMDLACGRSLTAQEAAKSLALVLHHHSEVQPILEDADNIARLCSILQQQASSPTKADLRERASSALEMVQKVVGGSESIRTSPGQEMIRSNSKAPSPKLHHTNLANSSFACQDMTSQMETTRVRSSSSLGTMLGKSPVISGRNSGRIVHRTSFRLSCTPSRDESQSESPSSTPRAGEASIEVRNGATVIRNTKLRSSGRKVSPGSMRKQRIYTDEDVEEIRRKAAQTAQEAASREFEQERDNLIKSKEELERMLKAESSQVEELKSVLGEYQLTMQTMVAKGNTQINSQNTALVAEKNRLKGELLEVSEAFETLKERYEDSKKTIDLFEAKENRFIEQIRDLKRNMVELQKWSNDLKANTEKKLSKAFESVTSYRASYIDKEAHAQKAISDLERTRGELEREQRSHAETAAKFSKVEAQLHSEQDAKSSAEASLGSTKSTLSRISSHKERLQSELDKTKDLLTEAKTRILELESTASRASEMHSQLDNVITENQSLKARAYDDMTQIKSLEAVVNEKDAELEEMSAICEEAMERLERGKLSGS